MPYLGDVGASYGAWVTTVQGTGGVATVWPFVDKFRGLSAARYPSAQYAALYNAGAIDPNAQQQSTADSAFVYVLASDAVQVASPQTMTLFQKLQNSLFTGGDKTADALGLGGTLDALTNMLKGAGKYLAIGAGVLLLAPIAFRSFRRNPRGRRRHRRGRRRHRRGRR